MILAVRIVVAGVKITYRSRTGIRSYHSTTHSSTNRSGGPPATAGLREISSTFLLTSRFSPHWPVTVSGTSSPMLALFVTAALASILQKQDRDDAGGSGGEEEEEQEADDKHNTRRSWKIPLNDAEP